MDKANMALKIEILRSGLTQRELARRAGIPESYISMASRGRLNLNRSQLKKIQTVLKKEAD